MTELSVLCQELKQVTSCVFVQVRAHVLVLLRWMNREVWLGHFFPHMLLVSTPHC